MVSDRRDDGAAAGSLGLPLLGQPFRLRDQRRRHLGSHFTAKFDRHGERWRARDGEVEPHAT
jgi:hypothetical protein